MRLACVLLAFALHLMMPLFGWAGEADVVKATAESLHAGQWRLHVTVHHADTGWEHYADAWEIVDAAGQVLDTRILAHPHVDEQPFTRSLTTEALSAEVRVVSVRARCSVHGYGGRELKVRLTP